MIEIRLKHALSEFQDRTGKKLTHGELAERTGVSKSTIDSMASRKDYNTTLKTIDRICTVLECDIDVLLKHHSNE